MKPPNRSLTSLGALFLLFAFALPPCNAQTPDKVLNDAWQLYLSNEYGRARSLYEEALRSARTEGNILVEGRASLGLGFVLNATSHFVEAREHLDRALELLLQLANRTYVAHTYNALGYNSWGVRDLPAAVDFYSKAAAEFKASGDLRGQANVLYSLAFLERGKTQKRLAEDAVEAAQQVKDARLEGEALHLLGDIYFLEGDYSSALPRLEQAISIFEHVHDDPKLALVLTSLGRLHRFHGLPEKAIGLYSRALAIQERVGDRSGAIQSLDAMAVGYAQTGDSGKSIEYAELALARARETGIDRTIAVQLARLGDILVDIGQYERAIRLLNQAIASGADSSFDFRALSDAYRLSGQYERAIQIADLGLGRAEGDALAGSRVLFGIRAQARSKLNQLPEALADVREALRLTQQEWARLIPTDEMKRYASVHWLSDLAIQLLFDSGQSTEALEIAERARARAFLDLLATREIAPKPDPELKSSVAANALSASEMAEMARRLHSSILAYWVAPAESYLWVVKPDGEIRAVRLKVSQAHLNELIEIAARTAGPAGAAALARGNDVLHFDESQKKAWRELYRILIAPARDWLPQKTGSLLTVIPHGPLFRLSFAALMDGGGHYLIERYQLHYAPAGAVLNFTAKKHGATSDAMPRYLLIADPASTPAMPDGSRLPALPGARREIRAISSMLSARQTAVTTGRQADEESVRELMPGKSIIHIATHAIVRDDQPMDSFFAFASSSKDTSGDGRLTAQEIYELDLNADLVVLSACRSGGGKITGDGVIGLSRAFFYSGTQSVVATLWDVADEPTYLLISEFYRSFQRYNDKSRALREAQLSLLRSLRNGRVKVSTPVGTFTLTEHPLLWAGFVLQGQP